MITLIDHRDSFTRNLEHLLAGFDEVKVIDRKVFSSAELPQSNLLVLSPGPGNPSDYPETQKIYQNTMGKIPILGVCLGFQLMMEQEGAEITRQKQVLHGVETEILADFNSATYRNMKRFHPRGPLSLFTSKPRKSFQHAQGCKNNCPRSYSSDSSFLRGSRSQTLWLAVSS